MNTRKNIAGSCAPTKPDSQYSLQGRIIEELALLPGQLSKCFYLLASLDLQAIETNQSIYDTYEEIRNPKIKTNRDTQEKPDNMASFPKVTSTLVTESPSCTVDSARQFDVLKHLFKKQRQALVEKLSVSKKVSEWIQQATECLETGTEELKQIQKASKVSHFGRGSLRKSLNSSSLSILSNSSTPTTPRQKAYQVNNQDGSHESEEKRETLGNIFSSSSSQISETNKRKAGLARVHDISAHETTSSVANKRRKLSYLKDPNYSSNGTLVAARYNVGSTSDRNTFREKNIDDPLQTSVNKEKHIRDVAWPWERDIEKNSINNFRFSCDSPSSNKNAARINDGNASENLKHPGLSSINIGLVRIRPKKLTSEKTSLSSEPKELPSHQQDTEQVISPGGEECFCPVCGRTENENPSMVACDLCDTWYHCLCVGFADDAEAANKTFYCEKCKC